MASPSPVPTNSLLGGSVTHVAVTVDGLAGHKGVLYFAGFGQRVILQGVHMVMTSDVGKPWETEERVSNLVFIGRNLPTDKLAARLEDCLV